MLIVDDDRLFAAALERTLKGAHTVVCQPSAEGALLLFERGQRFDVILCDLAMADMSGMDFHAALQSALPEQAARIVFLTGGAFTRRTQSFLDQVPNLVLEKPLSGAHLRALIDERVTQRRAETFRGGDAPTNLSSARHASTIHCRAPEVWTPGPTPAPGA